MKRICHTIHRLSVLVALLAAVAGTGAQERVFADAVTDRYLEAYDLNDRKEYLDAYAAFGAVARMMDRAMDAAGITVAGLDDGEFRFPYWPAVKSRAEVAYKLGLYADMREVAGELREALATRTFGNEALTEGYEAELARVEGCMYFLAGDYRRSEERLQVALTPNAGFDHADAVRDDLAQLYYRQERYAEALAQLDSILAGRRFGTGARVQGSGQERREIESQRALCLARMGRYADAREVMEEVVSFFRKENDSRMLAEALRKAAKVLMLEYDATGRYDARALAYYKEYLAVARKYVDRQFVAMSASQREQFWMAEQPFVTDCYRLEDKDPGLLYDVALFSKAVLLQMGRVFAPGMTERQRAEALSAVRVDWKKVRAALPASSAAVEFIAYGKAGKSRLGALVLGRKAPAPVFVEVGALDELTSLRLDGGTTVGEALASTEHEGKDLLYADSVLAGKIWNRQLVEALDGAASVYFAADGIFHLLAVEYLLPDALKDRKFYRLTSTRMLVEKRPAVRTEAMLLCGGVDYKTADDGGGTEGNDEVAYAAMAAAGAGLPYLEGSLAEVDSIAALRGEGKRDTLLTDVSASEAAVRGLMGRYPLVHIATHGTFPDAETAGTDIRPLATDEQLSRTCLYLAGAETNLNDRDFNPASLDGVLSARELASLDLSDVDLVVLSACQSGLGYVTADGVSGLQRGLKTAGVRAVVASLWEVDDQATAILMRNLTANLDRGESLHDAFFHARETLRTAVTEKRYRRAQLPDLVVKKTYGKPRYYDAFILIDGM